MAQKPWKAEVFHEADHRDERPRILGQTQSWGSIHNNEGIGTAPSTCGRFWRARHLTPNPLHCSLTPPREVVISVQGPACQPRPREDPDLTGSKFGPWGAENFQCPTKRSEEHHWLPARKISLRSLDKPDEPQVQGYTAGCRTSNTIYDQVARKDREVRIGSSGGPPSKPSK